jgi:hypothetical protein
LSLAPKLAIHTPQKEMGTYLHMTSPYVDRLFDLDPDIAKTFHMHTVYLITVQREVALSL